jgi:ketosteroid isomerase-like protein
MSDALDLVKEAYAAFKAGGFDALARYASPDVEFREDPAFPEAGTYRGPDAFRTYSEGFYETFDDWTFEVEEWIDAGDGKVVGLAVASGRGKDSGVDVRQEAAWIFTVRDGKIVRMDAYLDRAAALRAAGVR